MYAGTDPLTGRPRYLRETAKTYDEAEIACVLTSIDGAIWSSSSRYGWPTRPGTVNLRFARGQAVADLAVVPVDTAGEITLYNPSTGAVQLLGDIAGYYLAGTPSAAGGRAALFWNLGVMRQRPRGGR